MWLAWFSPAYRPLQLGCRVLVREALLYVVDLFLRDRQADRGRFPAPPHKFQSARHSEAVFELEVAHFEVRQLEEEVFICETVDHGFLVSGEYPRDDDRAVPQDLEDRYVGIKPDDLCDLNVLRELLDKVVELRQRSLRLRSDSLR